ncbi:hypothetical protein GFS24_17300 [Chitinophaga sp. SYP-B3965]|uniref:hypothetical protein n=1 Tax=Chitinophaga sp. SYP-B3965 TaxID=2663120 RepID=UPI001299A594|nr:hypothetical protein [Chitinophaga sp. SYP-B3965]MRG46881.1 hypothetical protein [Chitinophaga sp. SYP-B3965]
MAEEITENLSTIELLDYPPGFFQRIDQFIDNYSRLVKSIKLSLGDNVGRAKSRHTILSYLSYTPNSTLQNAVIHSVRNTAQHFEERLQDHYGTINSFAEIQYKGMYPAWTLKFGNGGYTASGGYDKVLKEDFSIKLLFFSSYQQQGSVLSPIEINIYEVWLDIIQIKNLLEINLDKAIRENSICCPPVREVSIMMITENGI